MTEHITKKDGYTITYEGTWTWVKFDSKPERDVLNGLKAAGFRWSKKRSAWYAAAVIEEAVIEEAVKGIGECNGGPAPIQKSGWYRCPTCGQYNLNRHDYYKGYQCNRCADAEEGVIYG